MRGNKLTSLEVKNKQPGRYCDGLGLWLQVDKAGNRAWLFRYMLNGRARQMGLGALHTVTLAEAREKARRARQQLLEGVDPIDAKHAARQVAKIEAAKDKTFKEIAEQFLRIKTGGFRSDKHRQQWHNILAQHAFPVIGDISVSKIDTALVLNVLSPLSKRALETASRLRARIERVLAFATVQGYRTGDNPARWRGHLAEVLPQRPDAKHHAAMPFVELPAFMAELRRREGLSARALEFLILTAARSGEVIGARWDEIDLGAKVWTVPAERTKANREHKVPLSDRAIAILEALPRGKGAFIFSHPNSVRPINHASMRKLLGQMLNGNAVTAHGFRSTFRDWCGERTNYPRDIIEFALAHKLPDKVEAAYRRDTAVEKRRRLMTEWDRYCSNPAIVGEVVPLHA